jgi:hypothetical protein
MRKLRTCAAGACVFFALTGSASAFTYDGRSGRPGSLVTIYKVQGSHWNTCQPYSCWTTWLYSPGPWVSRSPATSGAQQIYASFKLYRWNSGWSYQTTSTPRATIYRGYSKIRLPAYNVWPYPAGSEHWSVYITFRWYTAGGRWLGTRHIDMDEFRDYACSTHFYCRVGNGWVYLS